MLLPRFTIRTLLVICTAFAVVFVMVGTAYRGQYWAWGVTFAIVSVIVTFLVHAAWFWIVSLLARVLSPRPEPLPPLAATAAVPSTDGQAHWAADQGHTSQPPRAP
jgi:hypothetical protein